MVVFPQVILKVTFTWCGSSAYTPFPRYSWSEFFIPVLRVSVSPMNTWPLYCSAAGGMPSHRLIDRIEPSGPMIRTSSGTPHTCLPEGAGASVRESFISCRACTACSRAASPASGPATAGPDTGVRNPACAASCRTCTRRSANDIACCGGVGSGAFPPSTWAPTCVSRGSSCCGDAHEPPDSSNVHESSRTTNNLPFQANLCVAIEPLQRSNSWYVAPGAAQARSAAALRGIPIHGLSDSGY